MRHQPLGVLAIALPLLPTVLVEQGLFIPDSREENQRQAGAFRQANPRPKQQRVADLNAVGNLK
jgi:hypothetical protein